MKRSAVAAGAAVAFLAVGGVVAGTQLGDEDASVEAAAESTSSQTPAASVAPGQSWQAAYASCKPGETVSLQAGSHPAQAMYFVADKGAETDELDCTFLAEPGATVAGLTAYGIRHLTFDGIDVLGNTKISCIDTGVPTDARGQHPVDVLFVRSHLRNFILRNPQQLRMLDNEFGPSGGAAIVGGSGDTGGANCTDEAPSFEMRGNVFHDFVETDAASHMECLMIEGANDFVIADNTFYNCSVFDVFFKNQLSANVFKFKRGKISGNTMARPIASPFRPAGTRALSLSAGSYEDIEISGNVITDATLELRTDLTSAWLRVSVTDNRAARRGGSCSMPGITWSGNVYSEPNQNCPGEVAPPPPTTTTAPPATTAPPPVYAPACQPTCDEQIATLADDRDAARAESERLNGIIDAAVLELEKK
jgi:hypothetical protein